MLMPSEREQAIQIMVKHYKDLTYNQHNTVDLMLRNGHKGFSAWTDLELMRGVQGIAKRNNSFDIQNFLSTIAAEKFVLE